MKGAKGLLQMAHALIVVANHDHPSDHFREAADRWCLHYLDYLAQPEAVTKEDDGEV